MNEFTQKVAVITGAGSGIGRELARVAANLQMRVVLADVQLDALNVVNAELKEQGADVIAVQCDVRIGEQVQTLADTAMQTFGTVHLLFNNAGVGAGGLIWESTVADWEWVLGVNLWGAIHGVRVFTPLMLANAKSDPSYRAHIVNTASMAGFVNAPNLGVYNVSKHAVVALSETLFHDLNLINAPIGSSVLCPYFVATGIAEAERNRPADTPAIAATASQLASQSFAKYAMSAADVSARDVAMMCFDAIRENRFYVFPHTDVLAEVQTRTQAIMTQQSPADPYAPMPKLRESLRRSILGGTNTSDVKVKP
jgi:NAD(P)-dependent dehydrogenase (short-subunit alcohol dehydrogenase family)